MIDWSNWSKQDFVELVVEGMTGVHNVKIPKELIERHLILWGEVCGETGTISPEHHKTIAEVRGYLSEKLGVTRYSVCWQNKGEDKYPTVTINSGGGNEY